MASDKSDKKLFVMGLPKTYTNDDFAALMGDLVPVKKAFVITKKGTKECTGVGYAILSPRAD